MIRAAAAVLAVSVSLGCAGAPHDAIRPSGTSDKGADAAVAVAFVPPPAPADAGPAAAPPRVDAATPPPEPHVYHWLKGSTHVHSVHSGDSSTPVSEVVRWYTEHDYDFIFLTDHNKVTRVEDHADGALLVMTGIELTFNPDVCKPDAPKPTGKCRIHVNSLAPRIYPDDKLEWADRKTDQRVAMYERALQTARDLGGVAVLNHPSWHWGIDGAQLAVLAERGFLLFEVGNQAFAQWNDGDADHPGIESIWDAALTAGATIYGIASDDSHSHFVEGQYPAGTGWIVVDAERDPAAIRDALERGAFYGSTGVVLSRAGVEDGALVVEVDPASKGKHTIRFIGDGRVLREDVGGRASFALAGAETTYVRAVVEGPGGTRAWVQPARAPAP